MQMILARISSKKKTVESIEINLNRFFICYNNNYFTKI